MKLYQWLKRRSPEELSYMHDLLKFGSTNSSSYMRGKIEDELKKRADNLTDIMEKMS